LKILVVANNHNSIGIVDFCVKLKEIEKDIQVIVVCDSKFKNVNIDFFNDRAINCKVIQLRNSGDDEDKRFSIVNGTKELEKKTQSCTNKKKFFNPFKLMASKLVSLIFSSSLYYLAREMLIISKLKKYKANTLKLFKEIKPDVVLSLSDRSHDYTESSVLWAAREYGTKVILPYIAQFDIDASLQYRKTAEGKTLPELRPFWPFSLYKVLSYIKLNKQMYKGVFFQPPYILNASKKCGVLSTYPWWVGNGISDVVCVDSKHTAKKYTSHGVKADKVTVVGHVSYDNVFFSYDNKTSIRQSLFEKYSLQAEKKIIILSMPQYAEQGYISWEKHWDEINSMMKEVSSSNHNLLVSVHPRSDISEYLFVQDKYNCRIIDEPLCDIIGALDLFLASNSTTFSWAALCGVPSIALMSPVPFLYGHLKSIYSVDSNSNLVPLINSILNSSEISFEKDWELLSRDEVFGGGFNKRFVKLLHATCSA
jgi:hypothetical protein